MGRAKQRKTRRAGAQKRMMSKNDPRLMSGGRQDEGVKHRAAVRDSRRGGAEAAAAARLAEERRRRNVSAEGTGADMFFSHNTQLGPPYQVLVDTNFINFALKAKVDVFEVGCT